MALLDQIKKENDIKKLDMDDMPELAKEIRSFLIESVSKTGGHLASNLGAVELTMALHRCMDFPTDKIIFDVGHQSYTHKILTGRKDDFYKLRQYGGISGFPKTSESSTDAFNTGHSSTSISAAIGLVQAKLLRGTDERVCAVIGDGSMTGGMAFEALDQLAQLNSSCLVVLNDNEMSISQNVGGLSSTLSKIRVGKSYNEFKSSVENALLDIPSVGQKVAKGIKKSKDSIKNLLVPGTIFGEMGITYIGPIDGHDTEKMVEIFEKAFRLDKPVVVHVKTKKGKGYKFAERYPEYFHGVPPFDPENGHALKVKTAPSYTDVFAKKLVEMGRDNDKLVAITAAMSKGTGVRAFQKEFPDRTYDVGIAEQHALTFAAGLAAGGYVPVVALYSSFLQRGYDQLLHDICLQKLHVIIMVDRSGIVGEDGETHMGIYDTAFLRSVPNLTVIAPRGAKDLEDAMEYAVSLDGPVAIKYPKGKAYSDMDNRSFKYLQGKAEVINFSSQIGEQKVGSIALFAVGDMVRVASEVRDRIKEESGYEPELVNARFICPLDKERIRDIIEKFDYIAVLEEATKRGSVGEAVAYEIAMSGSTIKLLHYAIESETVSHGSQKKLREVLGLDAESIYEDIIKKIR